jgi:hypothetical protein
MVPYEQISFLSCSIFTKVDTKPQAQSNVDVTSFRRKQISQNFIIGTDGQTDGRMDRRMDGVTDGPTE